MVDELATSSKRRRTSEFGEMYTWHEGMEWNPVERVILERRSVRKYKEQQVPEGLVRRILEAGRFAPSAGNSQPWRFPVIREKRIIEEMERYVQLRCKLLRFMLDWRTSPLGRLAWSTSQMYIRIMPNKLHPIPFSAISLIADGKLKLFHRAPTVILILMDKRGVSRPEVDVGICGQNMVLAAHSLGLGTCWVGFVELLKYGRRWKKLLNVEYPYELAEGIVLGYPVGKPNGMVARETHAVEWFESGIRRTIY
jgi:nitroreductase